MGSWGTGLFQDDTACDVRDTYRELVSLDLDPDVINDEMERLFGQREGIDASTYCIAFAVTKHTLGRLEAATRNQALDLIKSGRALAEWAELTDSDKAATKARHTALEKVSAVLRSPQAAAKRLRPTADLKMRIDRKYSAYPWRKNSVYAYRTSAGRVFAFTAVALRMVELQRHYRTTPAGYELLPTIKLPEVVLLRLDYRDSVPPSRAAARKLKPHVRKVSATERKEIRQHVEEMAAMWAESAAMSLEALVQKSPGFFVDKSPAEQLAFYKRYARTCSDELALLSNREQAVERQLYERYAMVATDPVPTDRLTNLEVELEAESDMERTLLDWKTLDKSLK